jgi:hypothetical protein
MNSYIDNNNLTMTYQGIGATVVQGLAMTSQGYKEGTFVRVGSNSYMPAPTQSTEKFAFQGTVNRQSCPCRVNKNDPSAEGVL